MLSWRCGKATSTATWAALSPASTATFLTQTHMTAYAFFTAPRHIPPSSPSPPAPGPTSARNGAATMTRSASASPTQPPRQLPPREYFISAGHNHVRSVPQLSPNSNQFLGILGWGSSVSAAGASASVRLRLPPRHHAVATTQASQQRLLRHQLQYRRFNFGTRNENQFRVAFAIANIGSFGTLRRRGKIF